MNFTHFDSAVRTNEFWTMPIDRINQNLERNRQKDTLQRSGISAVFGCPLPSSILENIERAEQAVDRTLAASGSTATIAWRQKMDALHFSIYGLVLPDDYQQHASWPLRDDQLEKIKEALHTCAPIELALQGIGILGMGAISVRVSDSPALETLRDKIGLIQGISQERFGSRTKKIVMGRVQSPITTQDREQLHAVCDTLRDFSIGTLQIDSLEIVQYKNTLLEEEDGRVHIE